MAEEADENEEDATATGKGSVLPWIIVTLLCGGAGVAIPFLVPTAAVDPAPDLVEKEVAFEVPEPDKLAYVPFESVVVNINQDNLTRYLRIGLSLEVAEVEKDEITKKIEAKMPVLKNWILNTISDMDLEEIRASPGQNRLRREIKDEFNAVLFPDGMERIYDVLLDEYSIQ